MRHLDGVPPHVLGVDSGARGGLALVLEAGLRPAVWHVRRLAGPVESVDAFRELVLLARQAGGPFVIAVEDAHSRPWDGPRQAFSFGRACGWLEPEILRECRQEGTALVRLDPSVWKGACGLGADKHASLELARRLVPELAGEFRRVTRDDGIAEAVCMAALVGQYLP